MQAALKVVVVLVVLAGVFAEWEEGHNGRPLCASDEDMIVIYWRNNNDPTAYWVCETKYESATGKRCPSEQAFLSTLRKCVPWDEWKWETPYDPPTKSYENAFSAGKK